MKKSLLWNFCGSCGCKCTPWSEKTKRQKFTITVFSICVAMLLVTSIFVGIVTATPPLKQWMATHEYVHYIFIGVAALSYILMICDFTLPMQTKAPWNVLTLIWFNLVFTYVVGGFASYFDAIDVLCAAITFTVMMIALCIISCFVKSDQMEYGISFFVSILAVIWPVLLFAILNPTKMLFIFTSVILILLFAMYIVYDIRRVVEICTY